MPIHVFVGPTLRAVEVSAIVPDAVLHPPVAHGDLLRLRLSAGDRVVVIDGLYHHAASVRHKEILALLAEGVSVVGCSSMGALRAAELRPFGMVGHGEVFSMYTSGLIDADDEVAVAHTEAPEYRKLGEPLVTFRYAAQQAAEIGIVDRHSACAIVTVARKLPYTVRSWRAVEAAARSEDSELALSVHRLQTFAAERPDCRDIKAFDARDTLARLGELVVLAPNPVGVWAESEDWRRRHLYNWKAEFAGRWTDGVYVRQGDVLRYEQLYDAEFPLRWRQFALKRIRFSKRTGEVPEGGNPVAGALAVAADWALTPGSLTPDQIAEWLTAQEEDLPAEERLILVLIRSFRHCCPTYELTASDASLLRQGRARMAVAESYVVNEQVALWGPAHSLTRIKPARLRLHLADSWGLPPEDERAMRAAARDRGFATLTDAVEAARPFLLRHYLRAQDPSLPVVDA